MNETLDWKVVLKNPPIFFENCHIFWIGSHDEPHCIPVVLNKVSFAISSLSISQQKNDLQDFHTIEIRSRNEQKLLLSERWEVVKNSCLMLVLIHMYPIASFDKDFVYAPKLSLNNMAFLHEEVQYATVQYFAVSWSDVLDVLHYDIKYKCQFGKFDNQETIVACEPSCFLIKYWLDERDLVNLSKFRKSGHSNGLTKTLDTGSFSIKMKDLYFVRETFFNYKKCVMLIYQDLSKDQVNSLRFNVSLDQFCDALKEKDIAYTRYKPSTNSWECAFLQRDDIHDVDSLAGEFVFKDLNNRFKFSVYFPHIDSDRKTDQDLLKDLQNIYQIVQV